MLVVSACLLTSLAISAPMVLPAPGACALPLTSIPRHVSGRVTGFVSHAWIASAMRGVETELGAPISPGYLSLKSVSVARPGQAAAFTIAAVPDNVIAKIGDKVELNSRYRDPNLPCNFVPWTVNRVMEGAGP